MFCISLLDVPEHEWMVTDLPQLHDSVHEGLSASTAGLSFLCAVCDHEALLHVAVDDALQRRHVTLDNILNLK